MGAPDGSRSQSAFMVWSFIEITQDKGAEDYNRLQAVLKVRVLICWTKAWSVIYYKSDGIRVYWPLVINRFRKEKGSK